MVPLCDLKQQYANLKDEIDTAMQRVVASGQYVLGPEVRAFEKEVANFTGCEYAIGVGSGTDALHLSLRALGIGPGDEVITTPFTFIATTEAIGLVGAKPVFVDIDSETFNINVEKVPAAISSRTKAIIPVHLYGQPCNMEPLVDIADAHGIRVIEDCAQAMGAVYGGRRVGAIGDTGCLSFFPSKNLGCYGDGGMVVTSDEEIYQRIEMLRRHGGEVKYHHSRLGLNSRLDEIQAAILRVKLKHLDRWNKHRRQRAYFYNQLLAEFEEIRRPVECNASGKAIPRSTDDTDQSLQAVYHQYTIEIEHRDQVMTSMKERDVQCFPYYPVPLHLQVVHAVLGHSEGDFPNAERASTHCLSLPMFPELTAEEQHRVVESLCPAASLSS